MSCPHSSPRNLAGQAVMLKKLNLTFPYLDAKVPVSKEWKIIIVSSKSHTNTRCDDRWGGKKKYSYILGNCKNRFSQEMCPVGLEIFKISSHLEHWLWMFCGSRQNETSGILELCVCWPPQDCSPNNHRNPLLPVKSGERNIRLTKRTKTKGMKNSLRCW